jgi:putative Mg2+ transporter-C (MgtC) family protein
MAAFVPDWSMVWKVAAAYVLAFPVGWERERSSRSAGLRTFPLVAVASCGYMLTGSLAASTDTLGRILVGVMTGIGFIGGGAILKSGGTVHGTATAASLWNMGAIGSSVAYGRYELAVLLTVINYLSLRLLRPLLSRNPDV